MNNGLEAMREAERQYIGTSVKSLFVTGDVINKNGFDELFFFIKKLYNGLKIFILVPIYILETAGR